MPEKGIDLLSHNEILSFEEIIRIVKAASKLGINKIRLTGGEPLVRLNISELVRDIKNIENIKEVSMTTNGVFLKKYIDDLLKAGLDRVNISLDTLNKEKYFKVTRRDHFDDVMQGIKLALEKGLNPVKINIVVCKEINFSEIMSFVKLSEEFPLDIRFIELMPFGEGMKLTRVTNDEVLDVIKRNRKIIPVSDIKGSGPATYIKTQQGLGNIGFISPISHQFCSKCNKIRLTAEGFLKLCLNWNKGIYLKEYLRSNISDEELQKLIREAVKKKPLKHGFTTTGMSNCSMSKVGG
jgi:cyclic pyranopterin phosphate synthase